MVEIPIAATGRLRQFAEAGLISLADFHVARRMAGLAGEQSEDVILACALAVRELRLGSVCLDLSTAPQLVVPTSIDDGSTAESLAVDWPEPQPWLAAVAASPAVADAQQTDRPFRLIGDLLYLDRYYCEEHSLAQRLRHRSALPASPVPPLAAAPGMTPDTSQDEAIRAAARARTSVITGGPGSGKTTVVARIIDTLSAQRRLTIALTAPTGKAATRLETAVGEKLQQPQRVALTSGTIHRLLGVAPGTNHRRYDAINPLPYDLVIVDETSMVSITLMSWLVAAVADDTRLVMLGDPDQLASVEAGAVLADISAAQDLVTSTAGPAVVHLAGNHRNEGDIARLAELIRAGDADACLDLLSSSETVRLFPYDGTQSLDDMPGLKQDITVTATAVVAAASAGASDEAVAELSKHRLLCAHHEGPFGTGYWQQLIRRHLAATFPGYGEDTYVGQPLIVTRNSDVVSNGDVAVIVKTGARLRAAVDRGYGAELLNPLQLDAAQELHAMTIHKSQGSQFGVVSVVLPPLGSALLTRELLYTAITRAQDAVRLYGSPEALRVAVATQARRASGLRHTAQRTG